MKTMLPIIAIAGFVTACNSNPQINADKAAANAYSDTTGFAQYKAWKAEADLQNSVAHESEKPDTKKTVVYVPVKTPAKSTKTSRSYDNYESGSMSSESANAAKAPVKKGWSKAAKGAAIGAGTGAVAGAVINKKNRVVGGVIGGVLGGGAGYGVGRHMDKKDGRY